MSLGSLKVCPVILVMTMERVRASIVVDKIDLDGAETRHVDRIFQSLSAVGFSVQMDWYFSPIKLVMASQ